jgi:hypothetical protein
VSEQVSVGDGLLLRRVSPSYTPVYFILLPFSWSIGVVPRTTLHIIRRRAPAGSAVLLVNCSPLRDCPYCFSILFSYHVCMAGHGHETWFVAAWLGAWSRIFFSHSALVHEYRTWMEVIDRRAVGSWTMGYVRTDHDAALFFFSACIVL